MFGQPLQVNGKWVEEGIEMNLLTKIIRFLNGSDIEEKINILEKSANETSIKLDRLLEQAKLDSEQDWMIPNSKYYNHTESMKR
jgi:hypothetical protein